MTRVNGYDVLPVTTTWRAWLRYAMRLAIRPFCALAGHKPFIMGTGCSRCWSRRAFA